MQDNNYGISIFEMITLTIYLGSIMYILGFIAYIYIGRVKYKYLKTTNLILLNIIRLLLSLFLSIIIWRFWPFKFDINLGFVFYPAIISEIITLFIFFYLTKRIKNRQ